jgi:hypothetical protein
MPPTPKQTNAATSIGSACLVEVNLGPPGDSRGAFFAAIAGYRWISHDEADPLRGQGRQVFAPLGGPLRLRIYTHWHDVALAA